MNQNKYHEKVRETKKTIYKQQANQLIKNFKRRNIEAIYFDDCKPAVEYICSLIPDGAMVSLAGSESILQSGLVDALRKMNIGLLDRYLDGISKAEVDEMRKKGMTADILIASSNAVTADGKLVNQDGIGNRVAGMIFGPDKVILLVGMNKVVKTVDEAIARIKTIAAPLDSIRVGIDTPCSHLGFCQEPHCFPPKRICSQLVIIEANMKPGRISVVLVGEELGF